MARERKWTIREEANAIASAFWPLVPMAMKLP
jgi:hypothetical protein